jgi:hypothetical protein
VIFFLAVLAVVRRKWLAVSGGGKVRVLEKTGLDK